MAQSAEDAAVIPMVLRSWLDRFSAYGWADLVWSVACVGTAWVVGRLVAGLLVRAMRRWARKTDTTVDDAVSEHLRRPIQWLGPLLGIYLVFPLITLPERTLADLRHGLLIAVIFGAGWALAKTVQSAEDVVRRRLEATDSDNLRARQLFTQTRGLRNILSFLISVLTVGAALVTFESVRQIGAGLLASAGVAGVVIGFAAQRSIATVVAGVQIAIAQPIRIDDVVIVEGEWGWIEEITLTFVVVRIWDLRRLVVPITYFIEKPFQNWTRVSADLLGTIELTLDFSVPVDAIRGELTRILEASPYWDRKVNNVQVTGTTDRAMVVRPLFGARNSGDQWNLRCEVREKLIAFVNERYPGALPRLRAEVTDPNRG
ncbi:MAG: mechanosensitive ion channel [Polyangiaceae bacterium]|nr:mechanosensitive ion channel [Polyangiaceae bacterium]